MPPSRAFTKIGADDGCDDRHRTEHHRIDHAVPAVIGEENAGDQHGGDDRYRVGFEQVGGHAGAVADVVADVVGDHGRVARVIFRDSGFDLADQIGADVGAFGEDAAAQAGEDGDQRAAESQADHRLQRGFDRFGGLHAGRFDRPEVAGHAQQAQAHDQHAGDGAALEADVQRGVKAFGGGLRGTHVGAHRDEHADEAGQAGQGRTDGEADGGRPADGKADQHEQNHADDGDGPVLAAQIGSRAFLDGGGDFLHAGIAGILFNDPAGCV